MSPKRNIFGLLLVFAAFGAAGCEDQNELNPPNPAIINMAGIGELPAGVAVTMPPPAWYTVRPDLSMCMWPYCGGWWYRAVNATRTVCPGGRSAIECYVARLDGPAIDWDRALAYGPIELRTDSIAPYATLRVTEAWVAPTDSPAIGRVFVVHEKGNDIGAAALNDVDRFVLGGVDLGRLPEDQIAKAKAALRDGGLTVAGWLSWETCTFGTLQASKVWFRVVSHPYPDVDLTM